MDLISREGGAENDRKDNVKNNNTTTPERRVIPVTDCDLQGEIKRFFELNQQQGGKK